MKFLSKKQEKVNGTSLSILSKHWNTRSGFFSNIFSSIKMKSNEKLPDKMFYTSRLLKTPTNKYFLSLCLPLNENQVHGNIKEEKILFIDPGSKVFITGYDPSGEVITCGKNDIGRIARLLHYRRKLQSKIKTTKMDIRKKNKHKVAELRIGEKISNLVDELHRKLAKWLCENYTQVFIPRLNFHKLGNLYKKEKAKMASWSHCTFLKRLISKSREYQCKIIEVKEDYTSKTCSNCGNVKKVMYGRTYNCKGCNLVFDRDINASKNILLKFFTERAV
ncbi:transposase [Gammaproteobacteria bacterium]